MALAPLASPEALSGWLAHPFTAADATRAGLVLNAVSSLVRAEAALTWETTPVPDDIQAVVITIAARVFQNPQAAISKGTTTGPFAEQLTFADPNAVGLYLSPEEKMVVRRYRATSRGLWSLSTSREDPCTTTGFVPTPDGDPFPWYDEDVAP